MFEKIKEPLCMCCDHPLQLIEAGDPEYDIDVNYYKCPNCGLIEESYLPYEEERDNYPAYNGEKEYCGNTSHGYPGLCPECGHHIIWSGDFMRSEVFGDIPLKRDSQKKYDEIVDVIKLLEQNKMQNPDDCTNVKDRIEKLYRELIRLENDIDDEEDSLAPNVSCPYCGASIQLVYPMTSEEKKYNFYKYKDEDACENT